MLTILYKSIAVTISRKSIWNVCGLRPVHTSRNVPYLAGIYRPPSYKAADDKRLGKNFENAHLLNREIILGDFNIDFLSTVKFQKHPLVKAMRNLNMSQLVHGITRPVSKTCHDHIWSSHPERLHNVRTMSCGMSDHLPVIVNRKFIRSKNNDNQHTTITYRGVLTKSNLFHRCMRLPGIAPLCSRILMMWFTPGTKYSMALLMSTFL